ncbi:hypothetical protein OfM1_14800 [Lactovum odontotermitis]
MFEKEMREFALAMARGIIPGAAVAGYAISTLPLRASINSNESIFNQILQASSQTTSENLQGNAGDKAIEALGKINANSDFSKGVDSVR